MDERFRKILGNGRRAAADLADKVKNWLAAGGDETERTNRRLILLLVILLVLAVILYACGAGRKRTKGGGEAPVSEAPAAEAPVSAAEEEQAPAPAAEPEPEAAAETEAVPEEALQETEPAPAPEAEPVPVTPEETARISNYMNQSRNLISGAWIYGMDFDGEGKVGLYKQKTDRSEKTKLSKYFASYLHIEGSWLYYIAYNQESGGQAICRMRISGDGEESIVLRSGTQKGEGFIFDSLYIGDGCLYYTLLCDRGEGEIRGGLYRAGLDGKNQELILDKPVKYPVALGEELYYIDLLDCHRLHRCKLDGSGDEVLINDVVYTYVIDTDCIFYTSADGERVFDENMRISNGDLLNYQLRVTGREGGDMMVLLPEVKCQYFAADGEYLFFVDRLDGSRLYRLAKQDGTIDLLSQLTNVSNLEIFGNILLFVSYSEDWSSIDGIFACRRDGTGLGPLFTP